MTSKVACRMSRIYSNAWCHVGSIFPSANKHYKNLQWLWCANWNSVTRVSVRHHKACRVMPNNYPEWWNFQFAPNIHYGFFFLHTLPSTTTFRLEYLFFYQIYTEITAFFDQEMCGEAHKNTEKFTIFIQSHINIVKLNTFIKLFSATNILKWWLLVSKLCVENFLLSRLSINCPFIINILIMCLCTTVFHCY